MWIRQFLVGILVSLLAGALSAETLNGRVTRVIDGDTLDLQVGTATYRIRLTEIDAPEAGQPWDRAATQALVAKVLQREVVAVVRGTDDYGRRLGRIWLGERDVNRELVREGHAWAYRQYLTDQTFLEDETAARRQRIGLWQGPSPSAPWLWRRGARDITVFAGLPDVTDKRYCSQMTSCDEAYYYLREVGLSRLDGDGDGVPCESLCR